MSTEYQYIPDLKAQLPDIPAGSILSQTISDEPRLKVVLFAFAPGQELSAHTSAWPAALYVVEGKGELTLGEDTHSVSSGSWTFMPAQLVHSVRADEELIVLLHMLKE